MCGLVLYRWLDTIVLSNSCFLAGCYRGQPNLPGIFHAILQLLALFSPLCFLVLSSVHVIPRAICRISKQGFNCWKIEFIGHSHWLLFKFAACSLYASMTVCSAPLLTERRKLYHIIEIICLSKNYKKEKKKEKVLKGMK